MPTTNEEQTGVNGQDAAVAQIPLPEQQDSTTALDERQSAEVVAGGDVTADFPGSPAKKKRKTVQFESSVMCDESHTSTAIEPVAGEGSEDTETCVRRITNETKQLLQRWKETFEESESFEKFCPTQLEELLKEALAIEQNLIQQKEALKSRLERISQTLRLL